jgi:hypothetical protein
MALKTDVELPSGSVTTPTPGSMSSMPRPFQSYVPPRATPSFFSGPKRFMYVPLY